MWYKNVSTVTWINVISFLDLLAVGLTVPLYSTHLQSLGASHSFIGLLNSVYSATQIISGPIIGGWSDVKNRKHVLNILLVICAISYGSMGFTNSLINIFILRLILGVFKHIQSICKSIISDIVPSEKQTGAYGRSIALGSLGFMVGPAVAGNLFEFENGFSIICVLTMVIFILNFVIVRDLPDIEVNKKKKENSHSSSSTFYQIKNDFKTTVLDLRSIDWSVHWESFLLRFLFGLVVTTYFSNQALYLKEKYHLSPKYIGYIISFFSAFGSLSAYYLNILNTFYIHDTSCLQRMLHFFTLLTFSVLGVSFSPNLYILLAFLVPFSMSCSVLRVVSMELSLKKVSEAHTGSFCGASNSIMSLSRFITPLLTGILGDLRGEQSVILLSVIPASIGIITCIHLRM